MASVEEAEKFAEENGLLFLEASAKTGENVDEAFIQTAEKVIEKIKANLFNINDNDGHGIKLGMKAEKEKEKRGKCC